MSATRQGRNGRNGAVEPAELLRIQEQLAANDLQVAPRRPVRRPSLMPMTTLERRSLGWSMVLVPMLLFTQLVAVWPAALAATTRRGQPETAWLFGALTTRLSADEALMILVALVGALTSLAEVSFRFAASAGRDELSSRWTWGYVLRPVQGAVLAVCTYFALRAGLMGGSDANPLNPYGVAALAALVGLFTRQAFQKLKTLFNGLWGVDDLDADIDPDPRRPPNVRPRRRRGGRRRGRGRRGRLAGIRRAVRGGRRTQRAVPQRAAQRTAPAGRPRRRRPVRRGARRARATQRRAGASAPARGAAVARDGQRREDRQDHDRPDDGAPD